MRKPEKPVADFFWNLKSDLGKKEAYEKAARFILLFTVSFLVIYYLIFGQIGWFWSGMGESHAQITHTILVHAGHEVVLDSNMLYLEVSGALQGFSISPLCSGDFEISILCALIFASFDILLVWRIIGAFLGSLLLLILNPLRIALTIHVTTEYGMDAGDVLHDLIFRLFLFVILVMYYFVWYGFFFGRSCVLWERFKKNMYNKVRSVGRLCVGVSKRENRHNDGK